MAQTTQTKTEVIRYGDKEFPLGELTLEQAKELMARHFPELANPKVDTKTEGSQTVHTFSKQAGTKGNDMAARLLGVAEFKPISQLALAQSERIMQGESVPLDEIDLAAAEAAMEAISAEHNAAERAIPGLMAIAPMWTAIDGGLL